MEAVQQLADHTARDHWSDHWPTPADVSGQQHSKLPVAQTPLRGRLNDQDSSRHALHATCTMVRSSGARHSYKRTDGCTACSGASCAALPMPALLSSGAGCSAAATCGAPCTCGPPARCATAASTGACGDAAWLCGCSATCTSAASGYMPSGHACCVCCCEWLLCIGDVWPDV